MAEFPCVRCGMWPDSGVHWLPTWGGGHNYVAPPKYKHDCDTCEFLGSIDKPDPLDAAASQKWDLWFCPRCDGGSLIARYGSDGPNYTSSPIALLRRSLEERCMPHPALAWALMLLDDRER